MSSKGGRNVVERTRYSSHSKAFQDPKEVYKELLKKLTLKQTA
uniref:Uncharacterized protein n=1 Tax=Ligilactobacillus acidipiscis TaxID=89059 RepID=A0A2R8FG86_9LACO|nr:hypothetical protein PLAC02_P68 [Ligilactobacillus acidipiscis]